MTSDVNNIVNNITSILAYGIDAKQIYLFGSQVHGNSNEDSDYDFMVVTDLQGKNKIEVTQQARRLLIDKTSVPVDIIICDTREFNRRKQNKTTLEFLVATEGIKLYG